MIQGKNVQQMIMYYERNGKDMLQYSCVFWLPLLRSIYDQYHSKMRVLSSKIHYYSTTKRNIKHPIEKKMILMNGCDINVLIYDSMHILRRLNLLFLYCVLFFLSIAIKSILSNNASSNCIYHHMIIL